MPMENPLTSSKRQPPHESETQHPEVINIGAIYVVVAVITTRSHRGCSMSLKQISLMMTFVLPSPFGRTLVAQTDANVVCTFVPSRACYTNCQIISAYAYVTVLTFSSHRYAYLCTIPYHVDYIRTDGARLAKLCDHHALCHHTINHNKLIIARNVPRTYRAIKPSEMEATNTYKWNIRPYCLAYRSRMSHTDTILHLNDMRIKV